MQSKSHKAALEFINKGIPVFPCKSDKRPYTRNGFKNATTDVNIVDNWWYKWPKAMIGIPTGEASGISAIDVGAAKLPNDLQRFLSSNRRGSCKVRTPSGGYHLWFKHVKGLRNYGHGVGQPDVDIRGEGGYVIGPPSQNGSGPYRYIGNGLSDIKSEFPIDIKKFLKTGKRTTHKTPQELEFGERYPALVGFTAGMWQRGKPVNEIIEKAEAFNQAIDVGSVPPDQWDRLINFVTVWLPENAERQEEQFWNSTATLKHIRLGSQANRASPLAVLGCTLARLSCALHWGVTLPGLGTGTAKGSLSLFVMLVGEPGTGKDQALASSEEIIEVADDRVKVSRLGSGEGIAHAFKTRAKDKETGKMAEIWIEPRRVLFQESEIETVVTLGSRAGSTLFSELRSAWMSGQLGHAFVDPVKRLNVEAHQYRMCLVAGVQPAKAGVFLKDVAGGFPQRLLWMSALDRYAPPPSEAPANPGLLVVEPAYAYCNDEVTVPVCKLARLDIEVERVQRLRGDFSGDPLRGHWLFAKLRVAALLAMLHGETEVSAEWWTAAEFVMRKSDEARSICSYYSWLEGEATDRVLVRRAGKVARETTRVTEEERETRIQGRCQRGILKRLRSGAWVNKSKVSQSLPGGDVTSALNDVLDRLVSDSVIEVRDGNNGGRQYRLGR